MIEFLKEDGEHHEYWYEASDVAKYLSIKFDNKIIGRNKFLQFLRYNGAIMKDSNQPAQNWINMGLAKFHFTTKRHKQYGMCLFSDKGIQYIKRKIESGTFVIDFQKRKDKYVVQLNDIC